MELIPGKDRASDFLDQSAYLAFIDTWYHRAPARAIARLDAALARYPLAKMPPASGCATCATCSTDARPLRNHPR